MSMTEPEVKIIADSICNQTNARLTTFEVKYWRPLLPEMNTHRCLIGSTKISFDMPAGYNKGKTKVLSMTLAEFWDKWENGANEGKVPSFKEFDFSKLNLTQIYTPKDIEQIYGMNHSNINAACAKGSLIAQRSSKDNRTWEFTGQAFVDYRNNMGKRRFSIKKRLMSMKLRSYNTGNNCLDHTCITDCWEVGDEEVFEVKAGKYSITGTADHPLLTSKGWKEIKDITLDDELIVSSLGTGAHPDQNKKINDSWVSKWNKEVLPTILARQGNACNCCKKPASGYEVHHIEPRYKKPELAFELSNVEALCHFCHKLKHQKQGWQVGVPIIFKQEKVISITSKGVQTVYDIAVESPEHNFLANGVVAHNCFSRNAASSRAQSFSKRCDSVRTDPVYPTHWNAEQKGMVGGEEFTDDVKKIINKDIHTLARATANYLEELNGKIERITGKSIHKQYLNRYLEPFCSTTQLISSTEWENFFNLRCADDAQPEIKDVADKMKALLKEHTPYTVPVGEWHLPYITIAERQMYNPETLRMMSVARCARVSYKAYDGKYNLEGDIRLYNQLLNNGHYSPFEHVAQAISDIRENCANFVGWRQLRKDVE